MQKLTLQVPTLFLMMGCPGAGKTYFSRQLSELLGISHISGDRIRFELFEEPRYTPEEDDVVLRLMDYMAEELLKSGQSAIYDIGLNSLTSRKVRRELAHKQRAQGLTVWIQTDAATAFARASQRDRRTVDDKYSTSIDQDTFDRICNRVKRPLQGEAFTVISGKHPFKVQSAAILKRIGSNILLDQPDTHASQPAQQPTDPRVTGGRVDMNRRRIVMR